MIIVTGWCFCSLNKQKYFRHIFSLLHVWKLSSLNQISLKFVPDGPINNMPVLAQIMHWRPTGDKPFVWTHDGLCQTHICVTRPHWGKAWICVLSTSKPTHLHTKFADIEVYSVSDSVHTLFHGRWMTRLVDLMIEFASILSWWILIFISICCKIFWKWLSNWWWAIVRHIHIIEMVHKGN